jgi:hypothetical protein
MTQAPRTPHCYDGCSTAESIMISLPLVAAAEHTSQIESGEHLSGHSLVTP